MNYYEAQDLYRRSRNKDNGYKWGNNRRIVGYGDAVALVLHETPVVMFFSNHTVKLNTGGWFTRTTKLTMNNVLNEYGIRVFTRDGEWFVDIVTHILPYRDNMTIRLDPIRLLLVNG